MIKYAKQIGEIAVRNNLTISTAESCTGGLLSSLLTDVSGSSEYIKINFVTYSNEAKSKFVGVKSSTLNKYGAVSEETSKEMAKGLLKYSDIGISTTGIAGPTGGTDKKPVGTMFVSIAGKNFCEAKKITLNSNIQRIEMKRQFVLNALQFALEIIEKYYK